MSTPRTSLAISIPVHESPECVIDQAKNWLTFAPEAHVVFHFSAQANFDVEKLKCELIRANPNAHVNNEHRNTGWADGSLIWAHISNFEYAINNVDVAFFAFDASNTLLVREGLVDHITKHFSADGTAGYNLPQPAIPCASAYGLHTDNEFQLSTKLMSTPPGIVPCEGIWFDTLNFARAINKIKECKWNGQYATEEVYPVASWSLVCGPERRCTGNYILTPFEANLHITQDDVSVIHHGLHKNQDLFGVKRVPREVDHPLRKTIRKLGGY